MRAPKQPGYTIRLNTVQDAGDQSHYFSTRPFNKPQYIESRVSQWSPIKRQASDEQGSYNVATATVVLNDDDETLRPLVAEDPNRFWKESDASIGVLSFEGRAAALSDRSLFRAKLDTPAQYPIEFDGMARRRRLQLSLVDALKPYLESQMNKQLFSRALFPRIDRALEGTPIPLIGGEHSDAGAIDAAGNNAEQGLVPLIYVGTWNTVNDDPLSAETAYLTPPVGVLVVTNGTPGTRTVYYGVTFFSGSGETTQTIYQLTTSATTINGTDSNTVSWSTPPAGTTAIAVYRSDYPTPNHRITLINDGVTTSYVDDATGTNLSHTPPYTNQAKIPDVDGGFNWDLWIVCLGVVDITGLYGSNDAKGEPPSRINLLATAGVDFLIPGYAGWVSPQLYLEIGGLWFTAILGRGPRSQQAIDGVVTLAVSTCGYTDVGDGSGAPIQQFFPMMQHFINQFSLANAGAGWKMGDWAVLEKFSDGTAIINTDSVEDMQDLTKLFLNDDDGYLGHIYLREPITLREFLQMAFQTSDSMGYTNHHGQFCFGLYNPYTDIAIARPFRQYIEIIKLNPPEEDSSQIETTSKYQYDYNPDTQKYRSEIEIAGDQDAIDALQGLQDDTRGVRLLRFTRDQRTARDAQNRRNHRLKSLRYKQSLVCKLRPGLEVEICDIITITHPDGPIPRWDERPFIILSHTVEPTTGFVTLEGYDVSQMVADSEDSVLGDEDSDTGVLDFVLE